MRILSNGFPTNLPNSETVSQGGPANFARLFVGYLMEANPNHEWIGVILEGSSSKTTRLEKVFTSKQRSYFRLRMPKSSLRSIVHAKHTHRSPEEITEKAITRLATFMKNRKPDVVFLNGFGLLNWMLLKAAERANIPVVIQHAGIWTKELDIHKQFNSPAGRRLMKAMERDATRISAMEVFLNTWSRDYYKQNVAAGADERTTIIPLPFNFELFTHLYASEATNFDLDPAKQHIGVIARWDDIKNHRGVLAMARETSRRKLPWQFHSVVHIPNHKNYASKKRAYEKHVDVMAPMDRAGIAAFCRSVDLLLLPSLFDVSPTVVLEAVASGTPIVISPNIGYVHNFAALEASDWVIDPAKASQAVKALERVMGKPLPRKLTNYIKAAHDHRRVFEQYLAVFEQVSAAQKGFRVSPLAPLSFDIATR